MPDPLSGILLSALPQLGERQCGAGQWVHQTFLAQRQNFDELGEAAINRIEKLLNHRLLKCLGYRTADEVFREARGALAV